MKAGRFARLLVAGLSLTYNQLAEKAASGRLEAPERRAWHTARFLRHAAGDNPAQTP